MTQSPSVQHSDKRLTADNASTIAGPRWSSIAQFARLIVPLFVHVFGGNLMKRNVLQMVLGLAAMAVVLVGLESQANAFGHHGSCGSNGGASNGSGGSHGGLFGHHHRSGGCCGDSSCCEEKSSCGCEEKSSGGCESGCNSGGGRHHGRHGGGCNSGCGSCSDGGKSTCSNCEAAKKETAAPAPPHEKHEKHEAKEKSA
jgi:hypothetical protein